MLQIVNVSEESKSVIMEITNDEKELKPYLESDNSYDFVLATEDSQSKWTYLPHHLVEKLFQTMEVPKTGKLTEVLPVKRLQEQVAEDQE